MADRLIDFSALLAYQDKTVQTELPSQGFGLIECLKYNTPFNKVLTPSLKAHLQQVEGRTTEYTGLKESVITTTSVESFTIPAHLSTSEQKTLTAVSIFSGFQLYPAWFQNNTITMADYLANKYDEVFMAMANAKEVLIASLLDTYRNQTALAVAQINGGSGTFAFDAGLDTVTVNKAGQLDTLFANLKTLMRIAKKAGNYNIVVNEGGFNLALNEILKYGAANDKNLSFIQNMMPKFFETLNIAPEAFQFKAYLLVDGAIGSVQNYPFDFRTGSTVDSKVWGIMPSPAPYIGERLNVYHNKEAVDASSLGETTGHLRMTTMEEWGFLDKFFLVTNYTSGLASRVQDIVKITGATA
ncbi:MAG TPA: hypothetical protein VIK55_06645 [Paludibacter sp.]